MRKKGMKPGILLGNCPVSFQILLLTDIYYHINDNKHSSKLCSCYLIERVYQNQVISKTTT